MSRVRDTIWERHMRHSLEDPRFGAEQKEAWNFGDDHIRPNAGFADANIFP